MGFANGRLPHQALSAIPGTSTRGGGRPLLRSDAAAAYCALHDYALARWKISMALHESQARRAYREFDAQLIAKRLYGPNAATPGTSNHGLGINVDLMNRQQRWVMDTVGPSFGWSKRWSDAAWEWWHITYKPGLFKARPKFRPLRLRSKGKRVRWVQRRLRSKGYKSVAVTGFYGQATRSAVRRFQQKKNLRADGVVGPATWRQLAL